MAARLPTPVEQPPTAPAPPAAPAPFAAPAPLAAPAIQPVFVDNFTGPPGRSRRPVVGTPLRSVGQRLERRCGPPRRRRDPRRAARRADRHQRGQPVRLQLPDRVRAGPVLPGGSPAEDAHLARQPRVVLAADALPGRVGQAGRRGELGNEFDCPTNISFYWLYDEDPSDNRVESCIAPQVPDPSAWHTYWPSSSPTRARSRPTRQPARRPRRAITWTTLSWRPSTCPPCEAATP